MENNAPDFVLGNIFLIERVVVKPSLSFAKLCGPLARIEDLWLFWIREPRCLEASGRNCKKEGKTGARSLHFACPPITCDLWHYISVPSHLRELNIAGPEPIEAPKLVSGRSLLSAVRFSRRCFITPSKSNFSLCFPCSVMN